MTEKKEENNNPLLLECSAFYAFGKLLLEDKHKISKFTNKSIAAFVEQLANVNPQNKKDLSEKVLLKLNQKSFHKRLEICMG